MSNNRESLKLWAIILMVLYIACLPYVGYRMYTFWTSPDIDIYNKLSTLSFCFCLLICGSAMCFMFCKIMWNVKPELSN